MATLSPPEIADDLNLAVTTVLEHLRAGTIPGFQLAPRGPWRVDADVYAQWKADRSKPRELDPYRIEPRSPRSRARRGSRG